MKQPFPHSLAAFKRWASQRNVALRGVTASIPMDEAFHKTRRIVEVTNTTLTLDDGQTLGFRSSHAWTFDASTRQATFTLNPQTLHRATPGQVVYELLEL